MSRMSRMSDPIVEFLNARIAEVEVRARAVIDEVGGLRAGDVDESDLPYLTEGEKLEPLDRDDFPSYPWGLKDSELAFCAIMQPARILERCKAEQWVVREYVDARCDSNRHEPTMEFVVRLLAMPYADHPDFDPAWAIPGWMNFKARPTGGVVHP